MRLIEVQESKETRENQGDQLVPAEIEPEEYEPIEPELTHGIIRYLDGKYRLWLRIKPGQDVATLVLTPKHRET